MNTAEQEQEVQEAKERRDFLRTRLQALQADEERLARQVEEGSDKILQAFVEGQDPAKARAALMADRELLKLTREAIAVCRSQIAVADEIANREQVLQYRKQKADFFKRLTVFIDKDFAALMKSYQALEAEYLDLFKNYGFGSPEFPYIERQIFELFYGVFHRDLLPQDLATVQKTFAAEFESARKAK